MILVGTSGWSYPSGEGTWNGIFYPPRDARQFRAADELAYYAEHFETVEVNSTFYRPPQAALARRWVEQTPASFRFSVKLYQAFTHPMMRGRGTPPVRGGSPIPQPAPADFDAFLAGVEPLSTSDKMGMLLVQFPAAFHRTSESEAYLGALMSSFRNFPLAVELRHRSWSDATTETETLLGEFGATWVQIDEPKFRFSIRQNPRRVGASGSHYYLRLHGRNAANWWKHDSPDDRYNYLYSPGELREFSEAVKSSGGGEKKAYVYLNNHFAAKAVVNATVLKHQLGQPVRGEYRHEMVRRYPELEPIVGPGEDGLLSGRF